MRFTACLLPIFLSYTSALAVVVPTYRGTNMPVYYGVPSSPSDLSALDQHLAYTIPATGIDTLIIDVGWVQGTKTSTTIYPLYGQNPNFGGDTTITDDELNTTIAHLKAQGLKVGLKCHLWTLDNGYASDISPSQQWFDGANGYRNYIKHYASIAQAQNLDTFIIGNELGLASYASDSNWGHVISDVRARYSGPISYAALCEMTNTGTYPVTPEHTSWWSGLDYMGINAYYNADARREQSDPCPVESGLGDPSAEYRRLVARVAGGATEAAGVHRGGAVRREYGRREYGPGKLLRSNVLGDVGELPVVQGD